MVQSRATLSGHYGQNMLIDAKEYGANPDVQMFEPGNDAYGTNDVPLCLGHNERCRIYTAGTEKNIGRQFYKCPRQEGEQCDYFEWVDGMDGNLNETTCTSMGFGMYSAAGPA